MQTFRAFTLCCALLASTFALGPKAHASEIAPGLENAELRSLAKAAMQEAIGELEADERARLVGTYVAFDEDANDPNAMVACDDDGDAVVVITDAMLRLITNVAHAHALDEAKETHHVRAYADFLSRAQDPKDRLLPLPPGLPEGDDALTDARLNEAMSFVVGREVERLRARDLVCPHPTSTRERGDDRWTAAEAREAARGAARIYPAFGAARDDAVAKRAAAHGRKVDGGVALVRFFGDIEARTSTRHYIPTYVRLHPLAYGSAM